MCEHSVHGHATELEAQQGFIGVFIDQLSEPWKDSPFFFISMCWKNTVRERVWERVGHFVLFMHKVEHAFFHL